MPTNFSCMFHLNSSTDEFAPTIKTVPFADDDRYLTIGNLVLFLTDAQIEKLRVVLDEFQRSRIPTPQVAEPEQIASAIVTEALSPFHPDNPRACPDCGVEMTFAEYQDHGCTK